MHETFKALLTTQINGRPDYVTAVSMVNARVDEYPTMCLVTSIGHIYITKQQAMDFFGLSDLKDLKPSEKRELINMGMPAMPVGSATPVVSEEFRKEWAERLAAEGYVEPIIAKPVGVNWSILFLQTKDTDVVLHAQFNGAPSKQAAIEAFRHIYGHKVHIISVTEHQANLNPDDL